MLVVRYHALSPLGANSQHNTNYLPMIGEADSLVPLPASSDLIVCDEERCQDVIDYCGSISTPLRKGDVLAKQACYLPSVSGGGGPLIGETGIRGLLIATGHTCWGIQNSCATGKLMSEVIFEGKAKSAQIGSLDPRPYLGGGPVI